MIDASPPYKDFVKTITSDNGLEFCEHQYISKKLSCHFYFANPYCSWERELSENTNNLVRQYILKGTYLKKLAKKRLKKFNIKLTKDQD